MVKAKGPEAIPPEVGAIQADGKRSLVRFPLTSLSGLIAEAARVYRQMRDNMKGRSLVWVLSQIREMVEVQAVERLEQRLEELAPTIEGKSSHAYPNSDRQARAAQLRRWRLRGPSERS